MTTIPLYQIDAFADRPFAGNPAAVCPLERFPADHVLQAIAEENNLSETAFLVRENGAWRLRWFTPAKEVDLCGHATLAAAWVVFDRLEPTADEARFETRSGRLTVVRSGDGLSMDFPARPAKPVSAPRALLSALGGPEPEEVLRADYWMVVYGRAADVVALAPDMSRLAELEDGTVIVTGPSDHAGVDFVSRFFAPAYGIPEDPVTGSAHCTLAPYWARRLGRNPLAARQVSRRGGELTVEVRGDRVVLGGRCAFYMAGEICLPE